MPGENLTKHFTKEAERKTNKYVQVLNSTSHQGRRSKPPGSPPSTTQAVKHARSPDNIESLGVGAQNSHALLVGAETVPPHQKSAWQHLN